MTLEQLRDRWRQTARECIDASSDFEIGTTVRQLLHMKAYWLRWCAANLDAYLAREKAEREEAERRLNEEQAYTDLVAFGVKHYHGCSQHFAGEAHGPVCCRCRAEQAEAALAAWERAVDDYMVVNWIGIYDRAEEPKATLHRCISGAMCQEHQMEIKRLQDALQAPERIPSHAVS